MLLLLLKQKLLCLNKYIFKDTFVFTYFPILNTLSDIITLIILFSLCQYLLIWSEFHL